MTQQNKPILRFKNFSDDWEQRKLGNLLKTESSKQYITEANIGDYPVIQQGDKSILGYSDKTPFSNFNNVVLFGDHTLSLFKPITPFLVATDGVKILSSDNLEGNFLYAFLQKYKPESQGYKRHFTILKNETGNFPINTEEQQKIGTFFKSLDDTIALHQRKLELLKEQKTGFLQKMFPKNGSNVPEIRFSGFTEDWEQRKLIDVANIFGGGTPSTTILDYWDGEIDWYSPVEIGEQVYVNGSQKKLTELGLKKSSAKVLPVGTVLFTSRAGIGKTAILAKEGATNQGFQSIVPHKNELDSYFIYSRTNELKRYGEIQGAGSTFVEVSGKQMAKMPILIPILEEQTKIGTFFKHLDNTIALHQKQLEVLKETKKSLLQKMFV